MNPNDPRMPDPRMISPWRAPPETPSAARSRRARGRGEDAPHDDGTLIRPYMVTEGRTRPLHDGLRVETLVHAPPGALHAPLKFERRHIVEVCQQPRSVAEIAVALAMPLGVVRVLVADLVTDGYVFIQESDMITVDMLERIRDRVRAL
jgi:hypothetical protein